MLRLSGVVVELLICYLCHELIVADLQSYLIAAQLGCL